VDGRDGDGWCVRDFGLFAAKIAPYRACTTVVLITPSASVSAVAVGPQFVIITQPTYYVLVLQGSGSEKALCEANQTCFCETLLL
jgi:hypothetical protein